MSKYFWWGLAILLLGCGPLMLFIAAHTLGLIADPDPNPIGLGLLALITLWPGAILIVIGLVRGRGRPR